MSSYSHNSRRTQTLVLGISATLLGALGHAAGAAPFTLAAYSDALGGREILGGDYKAALRKIDAQTHLSPVDVAPVTANRCVALTLTAQWPAAQAACDAAVEAAEAGRTPRRTMEEHVLQNEAIAIAYTNRSVLKWLTADAKAAAQDLEHARSLHAELDVVSRNVTALGAHSTVTQVRSAEQR
jgi:hypothetical protein